MAVRVAGQLAAGLVLMAATLLPAADRTTLTGQVVTAAGAPVEHATVMVYAAGVRQGYSTYCPTCYPDCGKRTLTDAAGAFTIPNLSPDLWFRLLVIRERYRPVFVQRVDPLEGAAPKIVLVLREEVEDPARVVRGRVVDTHGAPLRDAIVQPQGISFRPENGRTRQTFGSPEGLEPLAVTNEKGEFEIAYARPVASMVLMIEARGMAPKKLLEAPTGADRQTIVLNDGAVVRGRLVQNGRPVGGGEIGLFSTDHGNGNGYDEIRVGTADDGSFALTNVPAPVQWYLYGKMESIASRGAVQPVKIATTHDQQEMDVGDLQVVAGHRIRGRVVLGDGKPIPEGMRVFITPQCMSCGEEIVIDRPFGKIFDRSFALRDTQTVVLKSDGRFWFSGLANGPYQVTAAVKGYALAAGYTPVRPSGANLDEAAWRRASEFNARTLREMNTVEVMVERDVDDLTLRLDPATGPARQ